MRHRVQSVEREARDARSLNYSKRVTQCSHQTNVTLGARIGAVEIHAGCCNDLRNANNLVDYIADRLMLHHAGQAHALFPPPPPPSLPRRAPFFGLSHTEFNHFTPRCSARGACALLPVSPIP